MPITQLKVRAELSKSNPLVSRQAKAVFFLVTGIFSLWAIPDILNDVLIHPFMKSFDISRLQACLVQLALYPGYFVVGGYGLLGSQLQPACGQFQSSSSRGQL